MDQHHGHPPHPDIVALIDTTLGARIQVLVLAQVCLGLLMIFYDLIRIRDSPGQFAQTITLIVPTMLIGGILYLFRHSRIAEPMVYLNLTFVAGLVAIADPISGVIGGATWVLFQIWPPLAVLTLRRPHAAISVVIPVALLLIVTGQQLTGVIPTVFLAPADNLIRNLTYQVLVLIILSITLYVMSAREQHALRAANQARAQLQRELEHAQTLAAEKDELNATLEQKVAERSAVAEQRAAALARSEERYALAARGANDGLWDWDLITSHVFYSPRWKTMLGYAEDEVGADPAAWLARIHADDRDRVQRHLAAQALCEAESIVIEYRIAHRNGSYRWMLCRGLVVHNASGLPTRLVGSQTDITEQKLAEKQLRFDAMHDALTGLPNRVLFMDRLTHAMRTRSTATHSFAVLFLDLDRFKMINDSLGHLSGDKLLVSVVQRLACCLRRSDTIARFGGDEFAILLNQITRPEDVFEVVDRIQRAFDAPFDLDGHEIFSAVSVGIALGNTSYERPENVLRDADMAMYQAKLQKAEYAIFDTTMHAQALLRLQVESDLYRAIERGELELHYQPIMELQSGRLMGFEALARWQHPTRGMLLPGEFIGIAEETGLISEIGDWSLREACRQLASWQHQRSAMPELFVSVNISAPQLTQPDLVRKIAHILQWAGIEAQQLKLEIVESALVAEGDTVISVCRQLKALGVQLSIDDFGTGYSSLSYLHRFPLDTVKIDRSFISQLSIGDEHPKIVTAIIALGRALGLQIIAEGIETCDQLAQLRAFDCDYGQGWLFARALTPAQAEAMIAASEVGSSIGTCA